MVLMRLAALAVVLVTLPTTLAQDNGTALSVKLFGGTNGKEERFTGYLKLKDGEPICNVVLYRQRWVISAAHCFDELGVNAGTRDYRVVLGDFVRDEDENEQQIYACHIKIHPDYKRNTKENDIALVKLSRPSALQRKNIELLPQINFMDFSSAELEAATCEMSGYGEKPGGQPVSRRRAVVGTILPDAACAGILNYNSATNLCYFTVESGPCRTDGGAPLTCSLINGEPTLVAIHSFEQDECKEGVQVATDIRQYRRFIKKTIEAVNKEHKQCADDKPQEKEGCGPEGKSFMFNYVMPDPPDRNPVAYVTAKEDTTISLSAHPTLTPLLPGVNFIVSADTGLRLEFSTEFSKEYEGKDNLGIRIRADEDVPIMVMAAYEPDAIGATFVFPEECLQKSSREYLVASYRGGYRNQLCMSALTSATFVSLHRPHESTIEFSLDEYESYCYISHEITGIIVRGSKELAVFGGNKCVYVPSDVKYYCDTLYEMMPPIHSLGRYHIIPRLLPRQNYLLRILSQKDGTQMILRNADGTSIESQVRDRGKFWETQVSGKPVTSVSCSEDCMVVQYGIGGTVDLVLLGDPSMVHIPHVGQFAFHYSLYAATTTGQHRAVIIIPTDADISKVTLNGNSITGDFSSEVIFLPTDSSLTLYSIYYVDLQEGVNTLKTTGGFAFGIIQYLLEFYRETAASPKCLSIEPPISS